MARNKSWGTKNRDYHTSSAAKRRKMKRAHERKTRQAAKKALKEAY
jgi:hypothetical protein